MAREIQLFSDFDGTVFNSTKLFNETSILVAQEIGGGLTADDVRAWNSRFKEDQSNSDDELVKGLGGFCLYVATEMNTDLPRLEVEAVLARVALQLQPQASEFIFDDAQSALTELSEQGNPVHVVTRGTQEFQEKFKWTIFSDLLPGVGFSATMDDKLELMRGLRVSSVAALYVDDRGNAFTPSFTQGLIDAGIKPVYLQRPASVNKYYGEPVAITDNPELAQRVVRVDSFDYVVEQRTEGIMEKTA